MLTRRGGVADFTSFPCAANMAFSLAAAAIAASLGATEVGMALWEGAASGAWMSHLERRFFLGGSGSGSLRYKYKNTAHTTTLKGTVFSQPPYNPYQLPNRGVVGRNIDRRTSPTGRALTCESLTSDPTPNKVSLFKNLWPTY